MLRVLRRGEYRPVRARFGDRMGTEKAHAAPFGRRAVVFLFASCSATLASSWSRMEKARLSPSRRSRPTRPAVTRTPPPPCVSLSPRPRMERRTGRSRSTTVSSVPRRSGGSQQLGSGQVARLGSQTGNTAVDGPRPSSSALRSEAERLLGDRRPVRTQCARRPLRAERRGCGAGGALALLPPSRAAGVLRRRDGPDGLRDRRGRGAPLYSGSSVRRDSFDVVAYSVDGYLIFHSSGAGKLTAVADKVDPTTGAETVGDSFSVQQIPRGAVY
jgi:hypothetical protein